MSGSADLTPLETSHHEFSPWDFWEQPDGAAHAAQLALQERLSAARGYTFGEHCFVSALAAVQNETLVLGERSYVAAGAYTSGTLRTGADCSINPYCVVRGVVRLGDGVRVGAHTSILGFNHTFSDPDQPVFRQPLTSRGIVIGSDVWIGSHVVVLDGVAIGSGAVVGAGAVVTKDVPSGAVVVGNPARVVRLRGDHAAPGEARDAPGEARDARGVAASRTGAAAAGSGGLDARLEAFGDRLREETPAILERSWVGGLGLFRDAPAAPTSVRAQCDAIELAALALGSAPPQLPAAEQVARLRSWQHPGTGLVGRLDGEALVPLGADDGEAHYCVLSVGYALDLLGSSFAHGIDLDLWLPDGATHALDRLPWDEDTWGSGAWVDALGTALMWNAELGAPSPRDAEDALLGWLLTRADPATGAWGRSKGGDLLQLVNGYYRASRGTLAQRGVDVPFPRRLVDTVLRHAGDARYTAPESRTACIVLDITHPLWLTRELGYRHEEVTALARRLLDHALTLWVPGQGMPFRAPGAGACGPGAGERAPGLQGTEMWSAIVWLLADLLGRSDLLGYRPAGVHRPEPRTRPGDRSPQSLVN